MCCTVGRSGDGYGAWKLDFMHAYHYIVHTYSISVQMSKGVGSSPLRVPRAGVPPVALLFNSNLLLV
jgi:hypothetical protein